MIGRGVRLRGIHAIQWHTAKMPGRGHKPPVGEPVLERALRLLDAFDASGDGIPLAELGRRSGLAPSTALRLARKLTELGLLERADDGRFTIGIRMLELASRAPRGHGIRSIALPFMEELHRATGHHVLLAVRDGDEAVLIERLSPVGSPRGIYEVGGRMPLAGTGVGLALLAFARGEYQAIFTSTARVIEPEGTRVDPGALRRRLARVRQDGVVVIARPIEPGYASVASPIFASGQEPVAAISIVAPPEVLAPATVRTAVVAIAGAISRRLGGLGIQEISTVVSR
jgi:DNA-binding IclR family transcriptional regulator